MRRWMPSLSRTGKTGKIGKDYRPRYRAVVMSGEVRCFARCRLHEVGAELGLLAQRPQRAS